MTAVRVIRGEVCASTAEAAARRLLRMEDATVERELFYPYYWFLWRASFRSLFGRGGGKISSLVDARQGVAATSDPFEIDAAQVSSGDVLGSKVLAQDAERRARRAAARAVSRRERALLPAAWSLVDRALVHKRFWVVRAGSRRLLVDAVTGCVHPLGPATR